jgi:hypothetical protein
MDLNEYGSEMNKIMTIHGMTIKSAYESFISSIKQINDHTQTEIQRATDALIGTENGPTEKKTPVQISNTIFGSQK